MELVTDLINLTSYFSRIFLQLVRLAIILGTFFLYNEVYVDYIYPFFSTNFANSTSSYIRYYCINFTSSCWYYFTFFIRINSFFYFIFNPKYSI
jgi:hypothetical protein